MGVILFADSSFSWLFRITAGLIKKRRPELHDVKQDNEKKQEPPAVFSEMFHSVGLVAIQYKIYFLQLKAPMSIAA